MYSIETTETNAGVAPLRIVVQSEKRAWRISRDFDANQRWRCRKGPSACRSSTARVALSRTPCQSTPTSSAGSASTIAAVGSDGVVARGVIDLLACCSVNQYDA